MADQGGGGSSVGVVAIIAILLLVGLAAWFVMGRGTRSSSPTPASSSAPTEQKSDVHVDVDLPDSVKINP